MSMIRRLAWSLYGRTLAARRSRGFHAHWLTKVEGACEFGEHVRLHRGAHVAACSIGRFTYLQSATCIRSDIGAFCSIGPEAWIGGLGSHPLDLPSTHPAFYSTRGQSGLTFADADLHLEQQRCAIGSDVWIGARAMILDGVQVGHGAVIGACALVAKDVPPYAVVGGVPARILRYRFSPEQIEGLLRDPWWLWQIDRIRQNLGFFRTPLRNPGPHA